MAIFRRNDKFVQIGLPGGIMFVITKEVADEFAKWYASDSNTNEYVYTPCPPNQMLAKFPTVASLALNGQTINAIKEYRLNTKCGLKEAKDAVEAYLAYVTQLPPVQRTTAAMTSSKPSNIIYCNNGKQIDVNTLDIDYPSVVSILNLGTDGLTRPSLPGVEKINAIKELRMLAGCGLKEAKDAVELWATLNP